MAGKTKTQGNPAEELLPAGGLQAAFLGSPGSYLAFAGTGGPLSKAFYLPKARPAESASLFIAFAIETLLTASFEYNL